MRSALGLMAATLVSAGLIAAIWYWDRLTAPSTGFGACHGRRRAVAKACSKCGQGRCQRQFARCHRRHSVQADARPLRRRPR